MTNDPHDEFERLVARYFDGDLAFDEGEQLASLLSSSAENAASFARASAFHHQLRLLTQYRSEPSPGPHPPPATARGRSYRVSFLAIAVSALFAFVAYLIVSSTNSASNKEVAVPEGVEHESYASSGVGAWVARLKRSSPEATWHASSGPDEFLLRLQSGQAVELLSGLAEIEFVSGAVLILHGPCAIVPTGSDSATLRHGRVTGRADNGNFHLQTPSARVDDLGTEFGVIVDGDSNTEVVVFEGDVNVLPTKNRRVSTIYLDGGATAHIGFDGEFATGVSIERAAFKRVFPRQSSTPSSTQGRDVLSLVDVINGGDGSESILAGAIDPLTGTWEQRAWLSKIGPGRASSDRHYHPSLTHEMIDGVFIPGESGEDTQITSAGHSVDLPESNGQSWGPIWGRRRDVGALPPSKGDFWGTGTLPYIVRRIAATRIGVMGLHSNAGITFDLKVCRELYGDQIERFQSRVVNLDLAAETRPEDLKRHPVRTADFFVFVDGKQRYSRLDFGRDWEGEAIDVPLSAEDRFLTLVTTDGGNETPYDHVMLIDPVLKLSGTRSPPIREIDSE
jgi:hypothetical protein